MEDATWFHANMRNVARSAVQGMCDYFGMKFVDPYTAEKDEVCTCPQCVELREKYNTLEASVQALRSHILNAVETFDKGKA